MFTPGRPILSPPDCVFTVNLQVCLIICGLANLLQSHFACFERRSLMGEIQWSGVWAETGPGRDSPAWQVLGDAHTYAGCPNNPSSHPLLTPQHTTHHTLPRPATLSSPSPPVSPTETDLEFRFPPEIPWTAGRLSRADWDPSLHLLVRDITGRVWPGPAELRGPGRATPSLTGVRSEEWHRQTQTLSDSRELERGEWGELAGLSEQIYRDNPTDYEDGRHNQQQHTVHCWLSCPATQGQEAARRFPKCIYSHGETSWWWWVEMSW